MRTWMQRNQKSLAVLWTEVELPPTAASAITGVNISPEASDIARTADSILSGAFTGDLSIALERSSTFCGVVARALFERASQLAPGTHRTAVIKNAKNLAGTAKEFAQGAKLWRSGELH